MPPRVLLLPDRSGRSGSRRLTDGSPAATLVALLAEGGVRAALLEGGFAAFVAASPAAVESGAAEARAEVAMVVAHTV